MGCVPSGSSGTKDPPAQVQIQSLQMAQLHQRSAELRPHRRPETPPTGGCCGDAWETIQICGQHLGVLGDMVYPIYWLYTTHGRKHLIRFASRPAGRMEPSGRNVSGSSKTWARQGSFSSWAEEVWESPINGYRYMSWGLYKLNNLYRRSWNYTEFPFENGLYQLHRSK